MTAWRSRHPLRAAIVLINIKGLLEAAGGSMADVVNQHREQRQGAGCEFFTSNFPASTLVEVRAFASPRSLSRSRHRTHRQGAAGS